MEKKKVLVVYQHYKPEPFRVSDICESLVKDGYEVQVLTGYPNYPEGIIYDGYGKGKHIDEVVDGVKIHRCYTIPRKTGIIFRFLNYYSFAISSTLYALSKKCVASDGKPFDVVFCNETSPVMMSYAGWAYGNKHKVPKVMYCQDIWPECLIAGGITRNSIIYKYYHWVSKRIYRAMDYIFISSRMFADYLNSHFNVERNKIDYLPQYAEGIFEKIPFKQQTETCDFMFAGNIGAIQSVETIVKAAKLLQGSKARFHIVGGGTDLERLKDLAKDLDNITFYGRLPMEQMPEMYAKADAMLVTLANDPVISLTLPGKIQSYMAVGKPVIGAISGEAKEVIEASKCGYCAPAEDYEALANCIKDFMLNENKQEMCDNARRYYEDHFQKSYFFEKLENKLNEGK